MRSSLRPEAVFVGPEDPWVRPVGGLPANALVLAIDTSTKVGGVALCRGGVMIGEETWLAGGHQTSQILPGAVRLWERAGLSAGDLQAVVVALGPGSFTGLRVGLSLGKGFAVALGIPVAGVPTLDVTAYQHREGAEEVCAVVEAGRGQLYVAQYGRRSGRLCRVGDYAVLTVDELAASLAKTSRLPLLCGELDPVAVSTLQHTLGSRLRMASSPAGSVRRPLYLAELGRWQLANDGAGDAASLQPIYLSRHGAY